MKIIASQNDFDKQSKYMQIGQRVRKRVREQDRQNEVEQIWRSQMQKPTNYAMSLQTDRIALWQILFVMVHKCEPNTCT